VKNRLMFAVVVVGALLGGCKQGKGERCQIQADCSDPLVCNQATQTCQDPGGTDLDAAVPADAPTDAPPDAPDAM